MRTRGSLLSVPLRGQLTLVLVLLVIGTTVAAGWISYRAAIRSVEDEAVASLAAAAAARDNSVAHAIARKRERLQSALESVELGCGISGVMATGCARETLRPFLRKEHAYGAALYYGNRQPLRVGNFVGGTEIESPSGLPLVHLAADKSTHITVTYSDRYSGLTLAADFAVGGLMTTTDVLRASTRVVSRVDGNDLLLGEDSPRPVEGPLVIGELGNCQAGTEGSARHQRQYISLRPSRAMADTCVAALRDEQEILAPVLRLKARIARVGMISGALALIFAYLLAAWLARPLVRLRQRVRALRKGDYDSPVPIVGVGEVRELALAFASMKDSVKAYRESLEENQRRLAVVYRAARLWIWEYNPVAEEILWHEPSEHRDPALMERIKFRALLRRVHRDDRHLVCAAVRKAKVSGVYDAEYRVSRPDGSIVWMSTWGQTVGVLRRRMIGVSLDISTRKNAETLIREKDRLEAAAEIAGSLAHEINNPLTAILGATYVLGHLPLADPAASRYVEMAEKEARRVAQLASQILGLYQQPATRVAIDVRSLLEEVVAACRSELGAKDQRVRLRKGYCGVVTGYREELVHAFSNVLRNAIESSPPGSEIQVRARLVLSADGTGWGIRVLFADPGPGIPPSELKRVFEAFTGTKPEKGTGLGLWVARSTIIKHGGTIRIRVIQGKRPLTVVAVFLPARSRGKTVRTAKLAQASASNATSGVAG